MSRSRQLAAIMFTDIVGYTKLMGEDEEKAFELLKKNRAVQRPIIEKFSGRWLKEIGDGVLASFPTVTDAVYCAATIQNTCENEPDLKLRIGIHEGEVVFEGDDVFGDGVNIASRLEPLAPIGGILVSESVHRNLGNKTNIVSTFLREEKLKNVKEPIKIYSVQVEGVEPVVVPELSDAPKRASQKVRNPRKVAFTVAGVLIILLLSYFLYSTFNTQQALTDTPPEITDKSIAVLPFFNDSPDQDNEYFCNGMFDEIITHLQKIADLRVKSRTSVEQYRNPDRDIREIAEELEAAFLVEGSVRKAGDNLRITVQLIDAKTGDHLWAETYDGKYTDNIFEFQSNIAKQVAATLKIAISPEDEQRIEQPPTTEILAWDIYQRGIDEVDRYVSLGDKKYLESARDFFRKAQELDPKYSRAFHGLGHSFLMERILDSAIFYADKAIELNPEDSYGYHLKGSTYADMGNNPDLALEYLSKADKLGPNNNWTNMMLGRVYFYQKKDVQKGLSYMNKALRLGGRAQSTIYQNIGSMFNSIGYYERANEYFKHALSMQDDCMGSGGYVRTLRLQGRIEPARQFLDSLCEEGTCENICNREKFYFHLLLKEFDQAEPYFNQYIQLAEEGARASSFDSAYFAYMYKELGKEQEMLTLLNSFLNSLEGQLGEEKRWQTYLNLAFIYAMREEKAKALQYLTEAAELGLGKGWHDFIEIHPIFESLRDDSEFQAIVKQAQNEKAALRAQVREMEERGELDL